MKVFKYLTEILTENFSACPRERETYVSAENEHDAYEQLKSIYKKDGIWDIEEGLPGSIHKIVYCGCENMY